MAAALSHTSQSVRIFVLAKTSHSSFLLPNAIVFGSQKDRQKKKRERVSWSPFVEALGTSASCAGTVGLSVSSLYFISIYGTVSFGLYISIFYFYLFEQSSQFSINALAPQNGMVFLFYFYLFFLRKNCQTSFICFG